MSGKDQEDLENKLNDGSQGLSIEETGILGEEPFESGRPRAEHKISTQAGILRLP